MANRKIESALPEMSVSAVADKPRTSKSRTRVEVDQILPPLEDSVSITKQYTYWLGVTSECPGNFLTCGGVNFPKITDRMEPDPAKRGSLRRIPEIGCLHPLTERQFTAIVENLPFCLIRFQEGPRGDDKPRKGYPIKMPSPKRIAKAKEDGKPLPPYIQQEHDEWAAKYMFMVLCEDQDNPQRGMSYPTIAEAGVEWPDELKE